MKVEQMTFKLLDVECHDIDNTKERTRLRKIIFRPGGSILGHPPALHRAGYLASDFAIFQQGVKNARADCQKHRKM